MKGLSALDIACRVVFLLVVQRTLPVAQAIDEIAYTVQPDASGIPECPATLVCCSDRDGEVEERHGLVYRTVVADRTRTDLTMSTYRLSSMGSEKLPVMMVVPGGAFDALAPPRDYSQDAIAFARRGFMAVVISVRVVPFTPEELAQSITNWKDVFVPSYRERVLDPTVDTVAAIQYIVSNSDRIRADEHNIALFGCSFGGVFAGTASFFDVSDGNVPRSGIPTNVTATLTVDGTVSWGPRSLYNLDDIMKTGDRIAPIFFTHDRAHQSITYLMSEITASELERLGASDWTQVTLEDGPHPSFPYELKTTPGIRNDYFFDDLIAFSLAKMKVKDCEISM